MYTLTEIVARFGGEVQGDASVRIAQVATLESAGADQISFFANPRYREQLEHTRAGAVIVSRGDGRLRRSARASSATIPTRTSRGCRPFSTRRARRCPASTPAPRSTRPRGSHPSASIGPFVAVGAGAVIGARTALGARLQRRRERARRRRLPAVRERDGLP